MANLYVADDGTIHDRDIGNCQRVISNDNTAHVSNYTTPAVSEGRKFLYWFISLAIAVAIGYIVYNTIGIHVFESTANPSELPDYIINFFCMIAPYVIIAGAVICAIIYGTKCAANNSYNLGTYFLSALSAAGGTVGIGVGMFLLALAITILLYILAIVFVVGIIVAILSGGD